MSSSMSSTTTTTTTAETKTETTPIIITFEDIAKYPGRAFLSRAGAPTKIVFGPDNNDNDETNETSLIYLGSDGNSLTQKLWKRTIIQLSSSDSDDDDIISELAKPLDGIGEEDTLSAEEKLRRERTRQLETGITNFEYSGNKKVLLCPIGNDIFIKKYNHNNNSNNDANKDIDNNDKLIQIVDSSKLPGSVIDPHISYDGSIVIFVCNNELYSASTIDIGTPPKQLTFDARDDHDHDHDDHNGIVNGLADFIAMEGT
jgi:dipeptidyl-peptidase-4